MVLEDLHSDGLNSLKKSHEGLRVLKYLKKFSDGYSRPW